MAAFHSTENKCIGIKHVLGILHLCKLGQFLLHYFYAVYDIIHEKLVLSFFIINNSQPRSLAIPGKNGIVGIDLVFPGTYAVLEDHFAVNKIWMEDHTVFTLLEFNHCVGKAPWHWIGVKMDEV